VLWPGRLGGGAGCQVALVVTLIPIVRGSTCDPPHEQLLMDVWRVLVHCALGKVVGGCQCKAVGKRGVGCVPAPYRPPSAVPSCYHLFPTPPLSFLPSFITRGVGSPSQGDSSSFFPKKSINLMVSMIE
jgi:hypothetical protein